MKIDHLNLPELGLPAGPYSHAVIHDKILHVSGFTAFGTAAEDGDISAQTRSVMDQINVIAASQGASITDLIKVTIFLTDGDDIAGLRDALIAAYEGGPYPASSMVVVKALFAPGLKVEIEAAFAL